MPSGHHLNSRLCGDRTAMVFNLTTRKLFKSQGSTIDIWCWHGNRGPKFGWADLCLEYPHCKSYHNRPDYKIGIDNKGINSLTNTEINDSGYTSFKIIELEVWEVIF